MTQCLFSDAAFLLNLTSDRPTQHVGGLKVTSLPRNGVPSKLPAGLLPPLSPVLTIKYALSISYK